MCFFYFIRFPNKYSTYALCILVSLHTIYIFSKSGFFDMFFIIPLIAIFIAISTGALQAPIPKVGIAILFMS